LGEGRLGVGLPGAERTQQRPRDKERVDFLLHTVNIGARVQGSGFRYVREVPEP
jgi:hypothetical protein